MKSDLKISKGKFSKKQVMFVLNKSTTLQVGVVALIFLTIMSGNPVVIIMGTLILLFIALLVKTALGDKITYSGTITNKKGTGASTVQAGIGSGYQDGDYYLFFEKEKLKVPLWVYFRTDVGQYISISCTTGKFICFDLVIDGKTQNQDDYN